MWKESKKYLKYYDSESIRVEAISKYIMKDNNLKDFSNKNLISAIISIYQEENYTALLSYFKPQNQDEAFEFLKKFQGKTHTVITSLVLYNGRKKATTSKTCKTEVTFAPMSDEEIQWYVDTGEWHGAAGGYRIQSLASCFIQKLEGSYSCVIGLPIFELYDILKEQGYSILE